MADEEASNSSQQNGSKKWKKSTFIFGGIIGLLILIPIVFSIFNIIENSTLKWKLEFEVENTKTMKAKLNNIQSRLELEIETREHENETLSHVIENVKSFVNYTAGNCYS